MSLLDPRVWLGIIVALFAAYIGGRWEQSGVDKRKYQAQITATQLEGARAQNKAIEEVRAEEQRRTAAQTEIANAAKKEADTARADARDAGAAADRLRGRVNELLAAARAPKDPTAPSGSEAAGDPLGVLADVLEKSDRRAGILAEYADQARLAGLACERSYDALTRSQ